jgi:hypothetical protein
MTDTRDGIPVPYIHGMWLQYYRNELQPADLAPAEVQRLQRTYRAAASAVVARLMLAVDQGEGGEAAERNRRLLFEIAGQLVDLATGADAGGE